MWKILLNYRQKLIYKELKKGFPKELSHDVWAVCRLLFNVWSGNGEVFSKEWNEWSLLSKEKIQMPYRVYVADRLIFLSHLTEQQKIIYHCIFSRSYDGYVREKHIKALLNSKMPHWAIPYVIKICDEYVVEILDVVYQRLKSADCEMYKKTCEANLDYFKLGHCRMISYWNEFYRYEYYWYRDYVGKKLYDECFGYRKTGQKTIDYKERNKSYEKNNH